jgi:hypothetical protein
MENYQKAQASGESISLLANDGAGATQKAITADTTLSADESGKTILLDAVGEVITLPAVASSAGFKYKFLCTVTTATTDWTIVAATNVIQGSAQVAGAVIAASNENTITLVVAKFLPGDWVTLECDGTNWYAEGSVVTTVGLTFTAP